MEIKKFLYGKTVEPRDNTRVAKIPVKPSSYSPYMFISKTIPEVNVTGSYFKYLNTLSEKNKNMLFRPLFKFIFGSKESTPSYKDTKREFGSKYRDNIINVSNGKKGERVRLEMMGAVKGENGKYYFKNLNYNPDSVSGNQDVKEVLGLESSLSRKYLKWCAENANLINRYYKKPTVGNAWNRHGVYGDSDIVVSPYIKSQYSKFRLSPRMASDLATFVKDNIDKHLLLSGDIVDMYYSSSGHLNEALGNGDPNRVNTHTGTIVRVGPTKDDVFVAHSMGNGLILDPIGNLLGSRKGKPFITGIIRPGTKEHKYD